MNHDEFAFANQQLAAILREGIPLEGAILRLAASMRRGTHRNALLQVESELRNGIPIETAVQKAQLPDFYCEMIRLGARSGDLPGVLTLLADYYRRVGGLWTRLRALLTYPLLVLVVSLLLSGWFAFLYRDLHADLSRQLAGARFNVFSLGMGSSFTPPEWWPNLWIPPTIMAFSAVIISFILGSRAMRSRLRWRLAPFKDASLARLAGALQMLIRQGLTLRESLTFAARMEKSRDVGRDLNLWIERHAAGHARFSDVAEGSKTIPPLFIWIVSSAGEHLADGFAQAAEIYSERARRRSELMLNLVLPCALLAMGIMIMGQIQPFVTSVFDVFTPIFQTRQIIGP